MADDRAAEPVPAGTTPSETGPVGAATTRSVTTIGRDWHWALGILGKTFITMGLLILAFVAYQLWGTGIEFRASQNALGNDFAEAVAAAGPATSQPVAATTTGPTSSAPGDTAPTSATTPTTTPTIARPRAGTVVASLEMPTISRRTLYIVSGVRTSDLKRGIGHFPDTALPGELGNAALAGHRTTYGAPFENLDRLEPGDPVIVQTTLGERFVYRVESSEIVRPDQVEVLSQVDDGTARLTLTTCHPKRSTAKRLVVYARLDPGESSSPRQRGTGQTATTIPASTPPTTTLAGAQPTTTLAVTQPAVTDSADTRQAGSDELARGWFHDSGAWPQILLWGALLVSIALGARWTGRRLGRRWLGAVVAAIPFVIVLYFVFQNVSRLLPPGF